MKRKMFPMVPRSCSRKILTSSSAVYGVDAVERSKSLTAPTTTGMMMMRVKGTSLTRRWTRPSSRQRLTRIQGLVRSMIPSWRGFDSSNPQTHYPTCNRWLCSQTTPLLDTVPAPSNTHRCRRTDRMRAGTARQAIFA